MKVSFSNLKRESEVLIQLGLMDDIQEVIKSGHFLFGPKMTEFEIRLSEMFKRPVVCVGSGTDALILSLMSFGIGNGDNVIIPNFSAIPTAVAVKSVGANPIYVDVDESFTINIEKISDIVSKKEIKAIIPVHLYGNPVEIEKIHLLCIENNILLIEDCAQSFGSSFKNKLLGTFGMSGALSFYPTKNLGCMGDGGAVVACDDKMADKIKELRFYGQKSSYNMGNFIGINSRMDEIQCTILLKKLSLLQAQRNRRIEMKALYDLTLYPIKTPVWRSGAVPHLYPIISKNRVKTASQLAEKGIETLIHYPFNLEEAIEKIPGRGFYSKAYEFSKSVLSIPFNPWMTDDEIGYVLSSLKEIE